MSDQNFTKNLIHNLNLKDSDDFGDKQKAPKKEDLQNELLIDQFFEAAWDTDDMLDYLGGNPFKDQVKFSNFPQAQLNNPFQGWRGERL